MTASRARDILGRRLLRKIVSPYPEPAPWWFRVLWRRIDRAYGYGIWRTPDETSFRFAFGNGYESMVQTWARRRGWVDLPTSVTPHTPLWWVLIEQTGMALHGEIARRWEEWRSVA